MDPRQVFILRLARELAYERQRLATQQRRLPKEQVEAVCGQLNAFIARVEAAADEPDTRPDIIRELRFARWWNLHPWRPNPVFYNGAEAMKAATEAPCWYPFRTHSLYYRAVYDAAVRAAEFAGLNLDPEILDRFIRPEQAAKAAA